MHELTNSSKSINIIHNHFNLKTLQLHIDKITDQISIDKFYDRLLLTMSCFMVRVGNNKLYNANEKPLVTIKPSQRALQDTRKSKSKATTST